MPEACTRLPCLLMQPSSLPLALFPSPLLEVLDISLQACSDDTVLRVYVVDADGTVRW